MLYVPLNFIYEARPQAQWLAGPSHHLAPCHPVVLLRRERHDLPLCPSPFPSTLLSHHGHGVPCSGSAFQVECAWSTFERLSLRQTTGPSRNQREDLGAKVPLGSIVSFWSLGMWPGWPIMSIICLALPSLELPVAITR